MSWVLTSLNLNGIRSAARKGFTNWRPKEKCDVLALQELRIQEEQMKPEHRPPRGWQGVRVQAEKKGYSGVATWSRLPVLETGTVMGLDWADKEGRCCWMVVDTPDFGPVKVISLYIPSGSSGEIRQGMKDDFLEHWLGETQRLLDQGMPTVVCGDYNIAHCEIDIHNPKANKKSSGFLPHERAWMDRLLAQGWCDVFRQLNPDTQEYSWWSNRGRARELNRGWRLDYHIATPDLAARAEAAWISRSAGLSDHAPVSVRYR
jgi:exodeoxyribonuclease-3